MVGLSKNTKEKKAQSQYFSSKSGSVSGSRHFDLPGASRNMTKSLTASDYDKLLEETESEGDELVLEKMNSVSYERQLEKGLEKLRNEEGMVQRELADFDRVYSKRRALITERLMDIHNQILKQEDELNMVKAGDDYEIPPGPACLRWVDQSAYTCICSLVIVANLGTMLMALQSPKEKKSWLLDQVFLVWYVSEVCLKGCLHQRKYLCGRLNVVWWNWLDLVIVVSGVVDQWVSPLFAAEEEHEHSAHSAKNLRALRALRLLRVFRVMRVLKIGKYFLQTDLSWVEGSYFQTFIMGVIALNTITMGLELDFPWQGWFWMEQVLLVIYVFELAVRLKQNQLRFFTNADWVWNNMDFVIVLSAMAEQWAMPIFNLVRERLYPDSEDNSEVANVMRLLRVLRLLRILRLARLLRKVKPLFKLIEGIGQAMQGMQWVLVLTFVVLYAFSILATSLVGHGLIGETHLKAKDGQPLFNTVTESMFLLFKLINDDQSIMDPLMKHTPISRIFFVVFIIVGNWMILATLTAVVSENMIAVSKMQEEMELQESEAVEKVLAKTRLNKLFEEADVDGSKTITEREFRDMLRRRDLRDELCDATGLDINDLVDLFTFLSLEDDKGVQLIQYEDFINCLSTESRSVSERSIFRVEKRIRVHEREVKKNALKVDRKMDDIIKILRVQAMGEGSPSGRKSMVENLAVDELLALTETSTEPWLEI